jgi:hypothetical protein
MLILPTGVPVSPLIAAAPTFHARTPRKMEKDNRVLFLRDTMIDVLFYSIAPNIECEDAVTSQEALVVSYPHVRQQLHHCAYR